jgi:hypothetical protein
MKTIRFPAVTCVVLLATSLPSAFGNHRTGSLPLPELIVAGDYNEDGKLDIAANLSGFDNVAILIGNGRGRFTLKGHIEGDTLPKGLATGDVNRDRHLDLVQCNDWGYNAILHLGDGAGGFGGRDAVVNGEGGPNRVLLRDFNNDRSLDLAVAGPDEAVVLIYLGDGRGGFNLPPKEIEDIPHNFGMNSFDFNRDGNLDIAINTRVGDTSSLSHVDILLGNGTGAFSLNAELPVNSGPVTIGVGDLNNDGKGDLVVGGAGAENTTGNFISTYLGDGTGDFTAKQTILLGAGSVKGELAVGDFNEDGNLDAALPIAAGAVQHVPSTIVRLFFGDGTGNLLEQTPLQVGAEPHTAITTDFDKDGHLDLAVSNRTDGTLSVLLGDGSGSFTTSTTVSVVCAGGVCE